MKRLCTAIGATVMLLLAALLILLTASIIFPSALMLVKYLTPLSFAAIVLTAICATASA
jgi:hypothetical protein